MTGERETRDGLYEQKEKISKRGKLFYVDDVHITIIHNIFPGLMHVMH
jgi:hypothetical protein